MYVNGTYVNEIIVSDILAAGIGIVISIVILTIESLVSGWRKQNGPKWLLDLKVRLFNATHPFRVRSLNEYVLSKQNKDWMKRHRDRYDKTYTVNCIDKKTGEWFVLDENDERIKSVVDCLPIVKVKYTFIDVEPDGTEVDVTKETVKRMGQWLFVDKYR